MPTRPPKQVTQMVGGTLQRTPAPMGGVQLADLHIQMRAAVGEEYNGWGVPESRATGNATQHSHTQNKFPPIVQTSNEIPPSFSSNEEYNGWGVPESKANGNPTQHSHTWNKIPPIVPTSNEIPASFSSDPSAPLIPEEDLDGGPIHHPSIDFSPVDLSVPAIEAGPTGASDGDNGGDASSCVICWEAPVEGACIPCGHMAGCMSCLNEIKAKKGVCPVCRAKLDQVIKLYVV